MVAINALNVMKEGHDGSGVGLFLRELGGPFGERKESPILSGIFTPDGLKRLDHFAAELGLSPALTVTIDPKTPPPDGTPSRGAYLARAYDIPKAWRDLSPAELARKYTDVRLHLRVTGEELGDLQVFSFWPDTVMIKEVGDPLTIGEYLGLDRGELHARRILAQGRQNTNYGINLYACHPFFLQGYCTMTNGENTAFIPIRDYISKCGEPGYMGYQSDSEVFAHILHYAMEKLGLGVEHYKHVITPLSDAELEGHVDRAFLVNLKQACRKLIIDGPNCVIGCTPQGDMFMAQDRKKLRPGVVGGKPGVFAFSSELCGLNAAIPDRDRNHDIQPMHLDTAIVRADCQEVSLCSQLQALPRPH